MACSDLCSALALLDAEVRLGELFAVMERDKGGRPETGSSGGTSLKFDAIRLSAELAVLGVVLLVVSGLCFAIEEWDRERRFKKARELQNQAAREHQLLDQMKDL